MSVDEEISESVFVVVPAPLPARLLVVADADPDDVWIGHFPIVAWKIDLNGYEYPLPVAVGVSEIGSFNQALYVGAGQTYYAVIGGDQFDDEDDCVEHAKKIFERRKMQMGGDIRS